MSTLPTTWHTLLAHPERALDYLKPDPLDTTRLDVEEPQPASFAAALCGGLAGLAVFGTGGPGTVLLGVMMGPGLGVAALYAGGALLWRAGRFFGGRGTPGGARAALALALTPVAGLALLAAVVAALLPAEVGGVVVGCAVLVGLPALFLLALKLWDWAARSLAAALELTLPKAHAVGALGAVAFAVTGVLTAWALRF